MEFYPLQGGDFSNTEIIISTNIYASDRSTDYDIQRVVGAEIGMTAEFDPEWDMYHDITLTFKRPADGRYFVEFDLYWLLEEDFKIDYLKVGGTFTPR